MATWEPQMNQWENLTDTNWYLNTTTAGAQAAWTIVRQPTLLVPPNLEVVAQELFRERNEAAFTGATYTISDEALENNFYIPPEPKKIRKSIGSFREYLKDKGVL